METSLSKQEIIRTIQLETLNNLKELDRICKKYNIQYFLVYGSLLGAVRHKGFIPWDDDLDIGMMREEYEKLCSIPAEEWDENTIFVQGSDSAEYHDKIFGRIYRKKSKIQSARDIHEWKSVVNGKAFYTKLMCDIYVYDYAPDDDYEYQKVREATRKLARKYKPLKFKARFTGGIKGGIKTVYRNINGYCFRMRYKEPWVELCNQYNTIAASKEKTKRICNYPSDTTLLPSEDYLPLTELQFEDMIVPVPNNYRAILKKEYGNYMDFPPENERYHIQFIYADLGNGTTFIIEPIPGSLGEKKETNEVIE